MAKVSAGLLMYRRSIGKTEIFLVHPGGPFYKNKDDGVWSIPKGEVEDSESDLLAVAKREFREETGFEARGDFVFLGTARSLNGKENHFWGFEGDADPAKLKSNTILIEWPPRTGRKMEIPEVDRGDFFDLETGKRKVWPPQVSIIENLEKVLK